MTVLQVVALSVVMLLGVGVVLAYDPMRQALVNGVFGLALVVLFVVLQAPDVALSELVVASIAVPLVLLTAIRQTRDGDKR
jgi:uncharacterized MnhB-related membrane protein